MKCYGNIAHASWPASQWSNKGGNPNFALGQRGDNGGMAKRAFNLLEGWKAFNHLLFRVEKLSAMCGWVVASANLLFSWSKNNGNRTGKNCKCPRCLVHSIFRSMCVLITRKSGLTSAACEMKKLIPQGTYHGHWLQFSYFLFDFFLVSHLCVTKLSSSCSYLTHDLQQFEKQHYQTLT